MSLLDKFGIDESDIQNASDYNRGIYPPHGHGIYKVNNCSMKISKKEKCPLFTVELECIEHSDSSVDLSATYSLVVNFGSDRTKYANKLGQIKKIIAPLIGKDVANVTKIDIEAYEKNAYFSQGRTLIIESSPRVSDKGKPYDNHIYHAVTPEKISKIREENSRGRAVLHTPTVQASASTLAPVPVTADSDPFDIPF